jgi:hypothetical protein
MVSILEVSSRKFSEITRLHVDSQVCFLEDGNGLGVLVTSFQDRGL